MKKIYKILIFILLTILSSPIILAQKEFVYSAIFQKGIIAPHHKSINYLIKNYIYCVDFNLGIQTDGSKEWHSAHHFPIVGAGSSFADFENPEVLGKAFAVYSFIDYPFLRKNNFEFLGNFAAGLSYLTKPLSPISNPDNFIISSHANAYLHIYFTEKFRLNRKIQLQTGFGITHYSNGATKKPNLGINLVTVSAAAVLNPYKINKEMYLNKKTNFTRNNRYSIFLSGGIQIYYPPWNKIYKNYSLNVNFERNFNIWSRVGLGFDIFYDNCLIHLMPPNEKHSQTDYMFPGIFVSYTVVFGRFSFVLQEGWHPKKPVSQYPKIYERWSANYQLSKHFAVRVALKESLGTAQFVEYGIGFVF
jgi:hypothetical protein